MKYFKYILIKHTNNIQSKAYYLRIYFVGQKFTDPLTHDSNTTFSFKLGKKIIKKNCVIRIIFPAFFFSFSRNVLKNDPYDILKIVQNCSLKFEISNICVLPVAEWLPP